MHSQKQRAMIWNTAASPTRTSKRWHPGVPGWCSRLRIQHFGCGYGHCCGTGSVPGRHSEGIPSTTVGWRGSGTQGPDFFFFSCWPSPWHLEVPSRETESAPDQRPKLQWHCQIHNLLRHRGTVTESWLLIPSSVSGSAYSCKTNKLVGTWHQLYDLLNIGVEQGRGPSSQETCRWTSVYPALPFRKMKPLSCW